MSAQQARPLKQLTDQVGLANPARKPVMPAEPAALHTHTNGQRIVHIGIDNSEGLQQIIQEESWVCGQFVG